MWALDRFQRYERLWALHPAEINSRCTRTSKLPKPNFLAFKVYDISAFIRTDRQTGMARIESASDADQEWVWRRFILPVIYFPTSLVYPYVLRVTYVNLYRILVKMTEAFV